MVDFRWVHHSLVISIRILTYTRYEFAQNEFVTCIACIPLESTSTDTGVKDFIVVGTTINRGEDLAVKGAVSNISYEVNHYSETKC